LCRHFKTTRNLDILKDPAFTRANQVYTGKLAQLKRMGQGATTHYDVILDDDLLKIASLPTNSPNFIPMKVWFTLQYHFARRGAENIHSMQKSDLIFMENEAKKTEVHLRDYMTKNHRETDSEKSTRAFITEVGGPDCPVSLVKKYLSLLNEDCPYIWQKPNKTSGARWF
jgi:hypothetical protein